MIGQKKTSKRTSKKKASRASLAGVYARYFVSSPSAIDQKSNISLEQPSPFKAVPSVVTYSVGEPPLMGTFDA